MASTRRCLWQRGRPPSPRDSRKRSSDQAPRAGNAAQNQAWRAMIKSLDQCVLYTFIDTAYLRGRDPAEIAKQLCDGGSDLVQLRAKNWPIEEVRRLAQKIAPIIADAGA